MIEHLNLIGLLQAYNGKGLEKCKVYGKITRKLSKPSNLGIDDNLLKDGIFVEMSVFAVNLKYHESYLRQCGYDNKTGIYMVNGDLIAYVDKNVNLSVDWFTINGTIRFGMKKGEQGYVCMFNFYKDEGKWNLSPCRVEDLDISLWDRHTKAYSWMKESSYNGVVMHPKEVNELPKFISVINNIIEPVQQEDKKEPEIKNTLKPVVKFNKENRQSVKEYNDTVKNFEATLSKAKIARVEYIKSLCSEYSVNSDDRDLRYMVKALLQYISRKPDPIAMTGRAILKKYLDNFKDSNKKYIADQTCSDYLTTSYVFEDVAEFILDNTHEVPIEGICWDVCKAAFSYADMFYAGICSILIGVSFNDMMDAVDVCEKQGISFIRIINDNPYLLQFLCNLSFDDIEKIALCFNRHLDKSIDKSRNIAMLNAYINNSDNGSTIYIKEDIYKANIGVKLTKSKYINMRDNGFYLTPSQRQNIESYIGELVTPIYSASSFVASGNYYVKKISYEEIKTAIQDYAESGLGVDLGVYVTSSSLLDKELFVFRSMYELGSKKFDYNEEDIDFYIKEYEKIVGFELEERQIMAVHLLVNAGFIVAGGAGSGKTTVSNCIVYVLEHLEPMLDIQFAAPTGKAAKRMQEVVHREVKTLHSRFKIGVAQDNIFSNDNDEENSGRTAFFFDEGAMITLDLLYRVLKRVNIETSRIFLFGDFNQLPPIGKGLPFKNLLRFMPCVFLNVTKRAAEGSMITLNSNYVNEYSDTDFRQLISEKDFFLLPCRSDQIKTNVFNLCSYYLGKNTDISYLLEGKPETSFPKVDNLTPDDIQVVTPLQKASYSWGSPQLNSILEPLFNPTRSYDKTFVFKIIQNQEGNRFVIGDRVIHVSTNMYSMQWYSTYKDGRFQKIYGQGICNGEVGKVVDFLPAENCDFLDEIEEKPDDFEYMKNLRDDETWSGFDKWFVVVEYYDYISARNFYILYRVEKNTQVTSDIGIPFKGEDLSKLQLFYAGTTHKLQGSQAKIVICVLDNVNYSGFITRQMIYTMFTRGEKLVFVVGSCGNEPSSMLSRARRDIASVDTRTVGELFVTT